MNNATKAMNRRRFLKRGIQATGAALGVPTIIPASALGLGGMKPPSERVTMGFIGLGGQGTGHLLGGAWTYVPGGYVARPDVQVLAVCDVQEERRERARQGCNQAYARRTEREGFEGVAGYNDFREVLARGDIDAVLLALPYHWAAPMSLMAMRAGKDVYCEKPIAITVREGGELIEVARRYGRIYQAGTQQRSEYGGRFRRACELVRNGHLGELKEVYAYRQPGAFRPSPWTSDARQPVPKGFDWDLWLGPLPWRPFNGSAGHALPGCFVGDVNWSPHHYDIIQWTVNPDPTAPIEVEYEAVPGHPDGGIVHYRYQNGVVVHSQEYPGEPVGGGGGACFVGTAGRIAVDREELVSYPARILREPPHPGGSRMQRVTSHSGNFLECIRSRRQTICHPETAVYTINAVLIGGIALILRRSLRWDPVRSEFPGDPEANRYLAYAPRAPWRI